MSKVNTNNIYYYDSENKWFKTRKGRQAIKINQTEAIKILNMHFNNEKVTDISDGIGLKYSVVHNFITKYEQGLLDKALGFICRRCGLDKNKYLKHKVNDYSFRWNTQPKIKKKEDNKPVTEDTIKNMLSPYAKRLGYLNIIDLLDDLIIPSLDSTIEERRNSLLRERELIESKLSILN